MTADWLSQSKHVSDGYERGKIMADFNIDMDVREN